VSLAGETLGAGFSFWLYRWGYKKSRFPERKWKWVLQIEKSGRGRQLSGLLLARLTPLVPSGLVTFAAACTSIPFQDFLLITLMGKVPYIALETIIGHDLFRLGEHWLRFLISIGLAFLIYILFKEKRLR
jgi:uncharacterized membrane protein YdjX (TVP38/TMEM64 family)